MFINFCHLLQGVLQCAQAHHLFGFAESRKTHWRERSKWLTDLLVREIRDGGIEYAFRPAIVDLLAEILAERTPTQLVGQVEIKPSEMARVAFRSQRNAVWAENVAKWQQPSSTHKWTLFPWCRANHWLLVWAEMQPEHGGREPNFVVHILDPVAVRGVAGASVTSETRQWVRNGVARALHVDEKRVSLGESATCWTQSGNPSCGLYVLLQIVRLFYERTLPTGSSKVPDGLGEWARGAARACILALYASLGVEEGAAEDAEVEFVRMQEGSGHACVSERIREHVIEQRVKVRREKKAKRAPGEQRG